MCIQPLNTIDLYGYKKYIERNQCDLEERILNQVVSSLFERKGSAGDLLQGEENREQSDYNIVWIYSQDFIQYFHTVSVSIMTGTPLHTRLTGTAADTALRPSNHPENVQPKTAADLSY